MVAYSAGVGDNTSWVEPLPSISQYKLLYRGSAQGTPQEHYDDDAADLASKVHPKDTKLVMLAADEQATATTMKNFR